MAARTCGFSFCLFVFSGDDHGTMFGHSVAIVRTIRVHTRLTKVIIAIISAANIGALNLTQIFMTCITSSISQIWVIDFINVALNLCHRMISRAMHDILISVKQRQVPLSFSLIFFKTLILSLLFLTSCRLFTIEFDKALIAKCVTVAILSSAGPYLQGRTILLIIIASVTSNTFLWKITFTVYQFMKSSTKAWRMINYPISILFCFGISAKDSDFI